MSTHPVQVLPFHNSHYHSKNVVDGPVQPNSQKSTPSSNSASQRALRSEALRLATFQGWPLEYLSPRELSRAGFFYRGLADQTQCAFCCITISQWEPNDDPMAEHRRHAPNCPFVLQLSVGNIPLSNNISGPSVPPVASSSRPSFVFPSLNGGGADTCSRFQNESRPNALPERGKKFYSTKYLFMLKNVVVRTNTSASSVNGPPNKWRRRPIIFWQLVIVESCATSTSSAS